MTDEAMSPLRRRMIEDMTIRKFAPKTQHDYVQRIKNFAAFLGRSPDGAATLEQVIAGDQNAGPNVRSFARKWRATADEDGHYSFAVAL